LTIHDRINHAIGKLKELRERHEFEREELRRRHHNEETMLVNHIEYLSAEENPIE
jgi:hypothetical protein